MAHAAAVEGVGFALLPDVTCREATARGELLRIELELEPAPLDIVAVYASRSRQSTKAKALLATMRDVFRRERPRHPPPPDIGPNRYS
jgi:DNA-binding transcriptional LysR family regulator